MSVQAASRENVCNVEPRGPPGAAAALAPRGDRAAAEGPGTGRGQASPRRHRRRHRGGRSVHAVADLLHFVVELLRLVCVHVVPRPEDGLGRKAVRWPVIKTTAQVETLSSESEKGYM